MFHWLGQNPGFYQLNAYTWESDDFRSMKLGRLSPARIMWIMTRLHL